MTQPIQKLTDSRDFQKMARNARRWTGSCFVVLARATDNTLARATDNAPARAADGAVALTESQGGRTNDGVKPPLRYGLTASRKVGNAVVRNRCKRRLREIVRGFARAHAQAGGVLQGFDIVIIARTCCASTDFKVLQDDFRRALRHLGVIPA